MFAYKAGDGFSPAKPVKYKKGGTEEDNKKIARSRVQVLLDPLDTGKMTIDTATLQVAKDNDIAVAITFRQFLVAGKFKRIRLLVAYRKLIQICLKKKNRIILATGAENDFESRSPEQLIAFGVFLGLTRPQAKWAISKAPEYVLEASK